MDDARKQTVLFAQLIEILTQNAVMMLGGMTDRQGRQRPPDLNSAEMMIEMISVLQKKTKGNLTAEEDRMLSGTLFQLQSAFSEVASKSGDFEKARKAQEAAEASDEGFPEEPAPHAEPPSRPQPQASAPPSKEVQPSTPAAESKVKFTKKYG